MVSILTFQKVHILCYHDRQHLDLQGDDLIMLFVQGFLIAFSVLLLTLIGWYSFTHRGVDGATELGILSCAAIIWTAGAFFEMISPTLRLLIITRDIQQFGVFGVPVLLLFFTAAYIHSPVLERIARGLSIFPLLSVLLILTNSLHHWVRASYQVEMSSVYGNTLIVSLTPLGSVLVGINFSIPLIAILALLIHRRRYSGRKSSAMTIMLVSFSWTFLVAWAKMAFLTDMGIHIPISVLYTPSVFLLAYALFRYQVLTLSPIARDTVFHVIAQGIIVIDTEGRVVDVNEYGTELLERMTGENIRGKGLLVTELFDGYDAILEVLEDEGEGEQTYTQEGLTRYLHISNTLLEAEHGRPLGSVLILSDITDRKLASLRLLHMSQTDPLTSLANRRTFLEAYNRLEHEASVNQEPIALLMMDLDHFKQINDTHGHSVGDEVLVHISKVLKRSLRDQEIVCRFGGEEFAALLPNTDRETALLVAERIRLAIEQSPTPLQSATEIPCTVSIGVSDTDRKLKGIDVLIREADDALYEAKHLGRNRTVLF